MRTLRESDNEHFILVTAGSVRLAGELVIPAAADGIVVFAHGSGSSRHSPRNRFVASVLQQKGLATLLFDLLTLEEEVRDQRSHQLRFDIGLLAERLVGVTDWLLHHPPTRHLHIGYFGASTGSAAALIAATRRPEAVKAIVSRGGRPDLAGFALTQVQAPTLLIVGGNDFPVISMNEEALKQLHRAAATRLEIVPGATHLFEEPGALEQVAALASQWFQQYLSVGKRE
ncbi:MAG TPA: dienelactone hydrolase family protein [Synechococcales cyanobacterium M55_K2018_004]|nr:dienelactone hydrolase family protein [Synechococcales cyanobacterium M55_K2018_004]